MRARALIQWREDWGCAAAGLGSIAVISKPVRVAHQVLFEDGAALK
jgi:hypothetical protein